MSLEWCPYLIPARPSGRKGLGGVSGSEWYSSRIPRRFREHDIQFKEAFAFLRAILCWDDQRSGHLVLFYCDNQDIVAGLHPKLDIQAVHASGATDFHDGCLSSFFLSLPCLDSV